MPGNSIQLRQLQLRKCVLKEEKPELPIVLVNDKGLISEGGLRKEVMKDIEVAIGNVTRFNDPLPSSAPVPVK